MVLGRTMRTLAIECATEACSVALFDDRALLAGDFRVLGRGHAEHLVPMIGALPDRGKAQRILVSLGPGSFTGIRIGIAVEGSLAIAWGAEVKGYPTLSLVAAMAAPTGPVTVSMALATIETDVTVSATDEPAAGGSTETLSQAEIDQLPDDQDELQRALEDIAGPGAAIRVDGFTGGRLPTRDQIARVVVRRDAYSAEFHQVGQGRVEITTRPGVDRWRGNAGLNVRPSGWSATNAVARSRRVRTASHGTAAPAVVRSRCATRASAIACGNAP